MMPEDRSLTACGPFGLRSALLLAGLLALAGMLKVGYHRDYASREPLAEVPYGDSVIYLDEAARIWGGAAASPDSSAGAFYKPPLYTLLLAKLDGSTAGGREVIRGLQLVLSLLVLAMVFLMARVRAGDLAAALACLLLLLYAPLTFHETKLLDTVPGLFLAVAACFALDRALRKELGAGPMLLIGSLFGLASLTRSANLLLVAGFFLLCPPLRSLRGLSLLLGVTLTLAPVAFYNQSEGAGGFVPVNYSEGHTFLVGNNQNARGMYTLPPGYPDGVVNERLVERDMAARALGHPPTPAEQRDHSYKLGLDYLREHPERIAGLVLDKLRFAISSYEVDDNYSLERERDRLSLLGLFVTPFSLLLALGLAGLLLPGFRARTIVAAPMVLTLGLLLAFYVASRYRLPAVPFLAIGAAVGFRSFVRGSLSWRVIYLGVVGVVLALPLGLRLPYERADLDRAQATFDQVLDAHASDGLFRARDPERAAATLAAGIVYHQGSAPLEARLAQLLSAIPAEMRASSVAAARRAAEEGASGDEAGTGREIVARLLAGE